MSQWDGIYERLEAEGTLEMRRSSARAQPGSKSSFRCWASRA